MLWSSLAAIIEEYYDGFPGPVTISRGVNQQRIDTMIWAGGSTVG